MSKGSVCASGKVEPFHSSTFSAAKQEVVPIEHSFRVRCLGPEMLDIGAVGIQTVHATLALAHHAL